MKYSVYDNGSAVAGLANFTGMSLTGFLLLRGDPLTPMEAASKQYVELKASSIKASSVTSGVFNQGRMPELTGAVTNVAGNTVVSLKPTGVLAGTYTKVTVNSAGLVTSTSNIVSSDIPNLNWNKVSLSRPTTLAGYGISNAVDRNYGVITGNLTLVADPVDDNDTVTKAYIDSKGNGPGVSGDIVKGLFTGTPAGMLRCNGGEVSKTTYASLYSVVGDLFTAYLTPGNGKPWISPYQKNAVDNGNLEAFVLLGSGLPGASSQASTLITKNRIHYLGGNSGGAVASGTINAPITSDGVIGTWANGGGLPGKLCHSAAVVTKNRVYLIGGHNGTGYVNVIYTAVINSDGTLGAWSSVAGYPLAASGIKTFITKDRIYALGGTTASGGTTLNYTAPIDSNGIIGVWAAAPAFPLTQTAGGTAVTGPYVYYIGGNNTDVNSSIFRAPINSDYTIGNWTVVGSLPVQIGGVEVVTTDKRVYIIGGTTSVGVSVSAVYSAAVNLDGTLGQFTANTPLPITLSYTSVTITGSKLYVIGGVTAGTTTVSNMYYTSFTGGANDYTNCYNGSILITDTTKFRVPDYSAQENSTVNFYVRY